MGGEQMPDVVPSLTSYPSSAPRAMQGADHIGLTGSAAKTDYRDAGGYAADLYHMSNRAIQQDMYSPYTQAAAAATAIKYPAHTSPSGMGLSQQSPAPAIGPLGLRRSPATQTGTPSGWVGPQGGYGRNDVSTRHTLALILNHVETFLDYLKS